MNPSEEEVDIIIYNLIQAGYLKVSGTDPETGEIAYQITEKGKKEMPELYEESLAAYNMVCFGLWDKGMVDIAFDEKGLPLVSLNKNTFDKEKIKNLNEVERFTLAQLIEGIRHFGDII